MWQAIFAITVLIVVFAAYFILGTLLINWVRRNCKNTEYYDILLPILVILMPMQAFLILCNLQTSWSYDQEGRNF